ASAFRTRCDCAHLARPATPISPRVESDLRWTVGKGPQVPGLPPECAPQIPHLPLPESALRRTVPSEKEKARRRGGAAAPANAVASRISSATTAPATNVLNAMTLGCASIAPWM